MESLFFNTPNQRYKIDKIFKYNNNYLNRVDISNGIFFYDGLVINKQIQLKNIDRMVMIVFTQNGSLKILNKIENKQKVVDKNSVGIYCSSRQDFLLEISGRVFILYIADFFLKRYLSFNNQEALDILYKKTQDDIILEEMSYQPLDALSLYLIEKIINTQNDKDMHSIRAIYRVIELITHRFSLIDVIDNNIDSNDFKLASKAKNHLLASFINPPTIEILAHLCATNESKLKKVFNKVYKSTIYSYIQKLRLEEANLLLREERMNIGEVAKRVGYKHQGHFSKLFFKTYGVYLKDLLKR